MSKITDLVNPPTPSANGASKYDATLSEAIAAADLGCLRSVISQMCAASEECREQALKALFTPANAAESETQNDEPASKRRKTSRSKHLSRRWLRCVQCNADFDTVENAKDGVEGCVRHADTLEMDDDAFPDDDDIQDYGHQIDVETDWRVTEYPENFHWLCCDEDANGEPCLRTKHRAV